MVEPALGQKRVVLEIHFALRWVQMTRVKSVTTLSPLFSSHDVYMFCLQR